MIVQSYKDLDLWPCHRATALSEQLQALAHKPIVRWTWAPAPATVALNYFASGPDETLQNTPGFEFVPCDEQTDWSGIDLLVLTAHGADMSARVMDFRRRNPGMLVALWLWDNHLAHLNNLKTTMVCDLYFPSHQYDSAYLANLSSPGGMHVPACSAQWTVSEARTLLSELSRTARSDQLLLNYVDYAFSWRSELLAKLRAEMPQADALLMPAHDRARYFGKSSKERMAEWVGHKTTLILPVSRDLSTRVFDALLAGQVIIVPDTIADFDAVFSSQEQADLGVVRVPDFELPTLVAAHAQAVANFDRMGEAGMWARSNLVLNKHLFGHRVQSILQAVRVAGSEAVTVRLTGSDVLPLGQRFVNA